MASSNSSNRNSSSKNSKFNSILNLSRSKNSSNILQVKEDPKYLQLISKAAKTNKKWYDVEVKKSKNRSMTIKKPRSSIPIECKFQCPQTSCCIRITNLSRKVTVDFLHQNFSDFGTIINLDLHFNPYDRFSKGFSYIMFSTPEESENAVRTMDKCEIDGYEVTCQQWFLPYTEACVSSILHGACSADRHQRYSSMHLSPTYNTQHFSQLDGLSSHNGSHYNSLTYDNIPPNKSLYGSARRSSCRSSRISRLRSRSNFLTIHHSESIKKSRNRSHYNEMCSKSSRSRSSKSSRSRSSKSSRSRSSKSSRSRSSKSSRYRSSKSPRYRSSKSSRYKSSKSSRYRSSKSSRYRSSKSSRYRSSRKPY